VIICTESQCQSTAGCVCGYMKGIATEPGLELAALRKLLAAYRRIYMDTQTHPTPSQEVEVMLLARLATQVRGDGA
jgi:hypothetical protein